MKRTDHLLLLKDHEIANLVNRLRNISEMYEGAQQLRGRISRAISEAVKSAEERYKEEFR